MIDQNFWLNKKVLVTGHTGFKGMWLTHLLLSRGAIVSGYSLTPRIDDNYNQNSIKLSDKINHNWGDLRDKSKLEKLLLREKPEIIFHLAAQALVSKGYKEPIETWDINTRGCLAILEASRAALLNCTIVVVTTDKVYKNNEWLYGYRENDTLGGKDIYSASKAAAEIATEAWWHSFKNECQNIHIATARGGNVIGGGDWSENRIIPDIIRSIKSKDALTVRNPKSTRPWQHVLECLHGYLSLAEYTYSNGKELESFNFGPEACNNQSVAKVIEECQNVFKELKYNYATGTKLFSESNLLHLSIEKAKTTLNWSPVLSFKDTIELTCNWYKKFLADGCTAEELIRTDIANYDVKLKHASDAK